METKWCIALLKKCNPFWKSTFAIWCESSGLKHIKSNFDIHNSTLWFNEHISKESLFFPKWAKHGISIVGDVITSDGVLLSREQIAQTYNYINILEYFRLKSLIKKFISKYSSGGIFDAPRPHVPFHMQIILQSQGRSKVFYNYLTKETNEATRKCEVKWEEKFNLALNDKIWHTIYSICFRTIYDNSVIWFQYKILFGILGTKDFLFKMKIVDSNQCRLCGENAETIQHLFSQCEIVEHLWTDIKQWIKRKVNYRLHMTQITKIFGYFIQDQNFKPVNFILLISRKYIFWCAQNKFIPSFLKLKKLIQQRYCEQQYLAKLSSSDEFDREMTTWKDLLSED